MPAVRFVKMSGAGNDFLVLGRGVASRLGGDADWIRRVCRRRLSVGADGVLFVDPAGPGRARVEYRNADGSVAFCGNGTRCAARFARLEGWVGDTMSLDTAAGEVRAEVSGDRVTLHLPPPQDLGPKSIEVGGDRLVGRHISAGVPHFVVTVPDLGRAPLERWGPAARRHPAFGVDGVNVDLLCVGPAAEIGLRTWERGVEGETLACGSGAVAAAFALRLAGAADAGSVLPASGIPLDVRFTGPRDDPRQVWVTGDARIVFRGELDREATVGFPPRRPGPS